MKFNLTTRLLIALSLSIQTATWAKKDTLTFNCTENLTKTKHAPFYVKVFKNGDGTVGVKQYRHNNVAYMFGSFTDAEFQTKEGDFIYFNQMGEKLRQGKFTNDLETGVWRWYKPNGIVAAEGEYYNGKRIGKWIHQDEKGKKTEESNYVNGKLDGDSFKWENDTLIMQGAYKQGLKTGDWKVWYENGVLDSEGRYQEGKRDGEWKFYFKSGKLAAHEVYEMGKPIKVDWFNEDGSKATPTDPLERESEFPGGIDAMNKFISEKVNYPEEARELGEQGVVYVQFYIDPDGTLSDIHIAKGVSESLDNEGLRVARAMPKWIPAFNHNRNERELFTFPIHFRLG